MMKIALFVLFLASLVFGQRYRANYIMTDPNIRGKISGTMYYSYLSGSGYIRFDHGIGVTEIYNFVEDVRYLKCSSTCEAESIAYSQPRLHNTIAFNAGNPEDPGLPLGPGCRIHQASGSSPRDQDFISVKSDGTICRIHLNNGVDYVFTSYTPIGTNFDQATFITPTNGCPQKQCNIIADFVFVFDESGSISSSDFSRLKQFGVDVVNQFSVVGVDGVRFSLIQFGYSARRVFPLSNDGRQTTINKIQATYQAGGSTCIPCGAELMHNEFGARGRNVFKVGLVLTDGFNNVRSMSASIMAQYRVHTNVVFAVGVGSSPSTQQLTWTASPPSSTFPQTVFSANSFSQLTNLLASITSATCQDLPGSPCNNCQGFCSCGKTCICPNICDDGLKCTVDQCTNNVAQSGCVNSPRVCNDNNACTLDQCTEGAGGDPNTGCHHPTITCDDSNACTNNLCFASTGCSFPRNDQRCYEGNACYIYGCDTATGNCTKQDDFGNPNCNVCGTIYPNGCPFQPCKIANCVAVGTNAVCQYTDDPCNDGSSCTNDTCQVSNGQTQCIHTYICDDNDGCTRDYCDSSFTCQHASVFTEGVCDDGVACTDDTCNITLPYPGCVHTSRLLTACNDDDPCTQDSCNETDSGSCDHVSNVGLCEQREEIKTRIGTCYRADCDKDRIVVGVNKTDQGNVQSFGDGCYLQQLVNTTVDICGVCFGDGSSCGNLSPPTAAFAIGGLFLAAIILAVLAIVAVAALLGGKKGYDIYLKNKGSFTGANTNPLYDAKGLTGTNPMYEK